VTSAVAKSAILILEDWQGYQVAKRQLATDPAWAGVAVQWATHSPYLVEALPRDGIEPILLDACVSQDEADAVGYAALDASRSVASYLDSLPVAWPLDLKPGWPLRHVLHRALSAYIYKAFLLSRLQGSVERDMIIAAVGDRAAAPVTSFNVMPNRFDTLFCVLAHRIGLPTIQNVSVRPTGAMENGDYMQPSFWSRATTILNAPTASVAYRLWRRLARNHPTALRRPASVDIAVAIMTGNELVEDAFLTLLWRGATLFPAPSVKNGATAPGTNTPDADIVANVQKIVLNHCRNLPGSDGTPFGAVADEIAERVASAIRYGEAIARALPDYIDGLRKTSGTKPLAVLSNAMTDGPGNLLRDALRHSNIPVLVAEHGVAPGLSTLHDALMRREKSSDLEDTMFWTPVQKEHAVSAARLPPGRGIVTGLPKRLRKIGAAGLQRHIVRRQLGLQRRCVTWCTGLYPNNMQFLPHYWRDTPYHYIRKDVLDSVLGKLDCDILLKLYPTYRYLDPDPLSDPTQVPTNVRIEQFADFRSLRAAADIVMIDGPGSILGWSWDIDRPLVFLETGMYTLLDPVREWFRSAVFYIDVRDEGWRTELTALLSLPLPEIRSLYARKTEARRKVSEHCMLGPEGSPGRRAADFIVQRALEAATSQHHHHPNQRA
jgi:hypothetical protein